MGGRRVAGLKVEGQRSKVKGQRSLGKGKKKPLLQGSAVSLRLHETEDAIEELF
jgi:hypothetical protein